MLEMKRMDEEMFSWVCAAYKSLHVEAYAWDIVRSWGESDGFLNLWESEGLDNHMPLASWTLKNIAAIGGKLTRVSCPSTLILFLSLKADSIMYNSLTLLSVFFSCQPHSGTDVVQPACFRTAAWTLWIISFTKHLSFFLIICAKINIFLFFNYLCMCLYSEPNNDNPSHESQLS